MSMDHFEHPAWDAGARAKNGWDMWSSEMVVVNDLGECRVNMAAKQRLRKRATQAGYD